MSTYVFIDGGYLRQNFKSCMLRYHPNEAIQPNVLATASALSHGGPERVHPQKVFYYDCVDERASNDKGSEDSECMRAQEERLDAIRNQPGWHVREGRLAGARKTNRRQKRVDVLLAVEMLSHAFNKNMQEAILIAGDDDFTPLVEELLRHGTYVQVWSDRRSGSTHLVHTADAGFRMGYPFYWRLAPKAFRDEHPLPDAGSNHQLEGGRLVEFAHAANGEKVKIVEEQGVFHFCTPMQGRYYSSARAHELGVLHEFLKDEFRDRSLVPDIWVESPAAALITG